MVVDRPPRQAAEAPPQVYRPIQYLGSKLRSLAAITALLDEMAPGGAVADPFCGTSVVAQALAARGHRVLASDVMGFAAVFATALLGVDRDECALEELATSFEPATHFRWHAAWQPWVERERAAIAAGDGIGLIQLSLELAQRWRRGTGSDAIRAQLDAMDLAEGRRAFEIGPLAASHYAGSYFGLMQALEIDAIRHSIAQARTTGQIGRWGEAALLTALLAAASDATFSAGKHYAQPHAIHRSKDLSFASQRIVSDRRVDVRSAFAKHLREVLAGARPASEGHEAVRAPVEALSGPEWLAQSSVIYADPPYTAQQYSRFYHVPEVLVTYRVPTLQMNGDTVTQGLYPNDRFKSAFSSKRAAPDAFNSLCRASREARAALVLSYSATTSGETGNDRMIGLDELLQTCERHYPGRVELIELDHAYRQFNGADLAVGDRRDAEYLVACRADPR